MRVEILPAARFVELIKNGFGLAQDGGTDATGKPSLLRVALLAREFDDVIRYDKGPRAFQRLLLSLLTPLPKLKGFKGNYAEYLDPPPAAIIPVDQLDRTALYSFRSG